MGRTLDGNRLKEVRVFGQQIPGSISDHCISASLSLSSSQVTQMSLSFADTPDGYLHSSGVLAPGTNIDYGGWQLVVDDTTFGPGSTGPTLSIQAPSRHVAKMKADSGAYSWGTRDVSRFVHEHCLWYGIRSIVQPGLGSREIIRSGPTPEQPDAAPENSWDVLVKLAREVGVWLYEVRDTIYFGQPTWLRDNAMHRIPLYWNSWGDYSEALVQMPTFSGSGAGEKQGLQLALIAPDADEIVPGDIISLSGRGMGKGTGVWIVHSVSFPMNVTGPVSISCERVNNPSPGSAAPDPAAGVGATSINWAPGNFTTASFPGRDSFVWKQIYEPGSAYDFLMNLFNSKILGLGGGGDAPLGVPGQQGFVHPVPGAYMTQSYHAGHNGVDLAAASGSNIRAAFGGRVSFSGWSSNGGGNEIHIDHPNGLQTWYAHNLRNLVRVGDLVQTGQTIAYVGSTGNSTGPHCHYMVLRGGWPNHMDPLPYLGGS